MQRHPPSRSDSQTCRARNRQFAGQHLGERGFASQSAQQVLNYLRGDQSNEGVGTTNFRIRSHILGDHRLRRRPSPSARPASRTSDAGNPGYTAFAAAKERARQRSTSAATTACCTRSTIRPRPTPARKPGRSFPRRCSAPAIRTTRAARRRPRFQIGALTYRRGGIPLFEHKFYVNATPRVWDIDFANTNTRRHR